MCLLLEVPRTVSRATLSKADGAFSIAGPKLWNDLPAHIQNCTSLDIFKSKLKTFIFKEYFEIVQISFLTVETM